MTDETRELIALALAGELSPAQSERLLAICRADEATRTEFAKLAIADRLLRGAHSEATTEMAAREVIQRLRTSPEAAAGVIKRIQRKTWWNVFGPRLAWASCALATLAMAGWYVNSHRPAASITRAEAALWSGSRFKPGHSLRAGQRVVLNSGLVEVQFEDGASVVVEGPADFEIRNRASAYLHRGRAVAHVPEQARGFVIDSPRGRLIDLGTEFGIAVGDSGDTEVHVLEGRVDAKLAGQKEPLELRASEAIQLARTGTTWIKADQTAFVTEMPPRAERTPAFIHWSFDEGDGGLAHNTGRGLAEDDADLQLKSFVPKGATPKWIDGPFGRALAFDGQQSFAESNYRGISGRQARTVAAWIRVPTDFTPKQGYGIIGWGHTAPGRAWQLSANPIPAEGDIGRLRIGAAKGAVVGSRDLRDGAWHHVAAVMYGGSRPDMGTHVLLYVDAQLDPASRKSMMEILTDPEGADHGLMLGRNIGFRGQPSSQMEGGAFFRGDVDEVFIVAGALSQEQITRLMRENKL